MKHVLFIDRLENLVVKKDSTLMLALTMKENGLDVKLLFEDDFSFVNDNDQAWDMYDFSGSFHNGEYYVESFILGESEKTLIDHKSIIHMRIDPPFDKRYLRYLWMLKAIQRRTGAKVMNSPEGIMLHNEKLFPYQEVGSMDSFVGGGLGPFVEFCERMLAKGKEFLILKPLDLYQGIGVEKVRLDPSLKEAKKSFLSKVKNYQGAVVVQPYNEQVEKGEVRSVFFKGKELGSILKIPQSGEFLANIAQGAEYHSVELSEIQKSKCQTMANQLALCGVDWIAYDILGNFIQEVNITCPGLMVEVSRGMGRNLCQSVVDLLHEENSFG